MFIFPAPSLTAKVETHIHEQVRAAAPAFYLGFITAAFIAKAGQYIAIVSVLFGTVVIQALKSNFPEGSPQYNAILDLTAHFFIWFFVASFFGYICRIHFWNKLQPYVQRATETYSMPR